MYSADWTSAAVLVSEACVWYWAERNSPVVGSNRKLSVLCRALYKMLTPEGSVHFLVEHVDVSLDYSIKEKHTQSW